jgi:hypothetical protein
VLDADFDPNAAIKRNATAILRQRMLRGLSVGNLFNVLLDTTDFIQRLPGRLSAVLEVLSERDMKLKVDAIDEEYLLKGMHKVANRITAGLVLAALIIGAALLMRVETSFTILGYPGFAILLFAAAAAGGFLLVARIFIQDHRHENEITEHGRKRRI